MPGPALNPIANTAPVAPAKSLAGTRPDASAEAAPADAGEQGFATELKRQMRSGEAGSDDDSARPADAANEADQARADGQTAADGAAMSPVPPEMAALLAGLAPPAAPPRADAATGDAPASDSPRAGRAALLPTADGDSGKPAAATADLTGQPAKLAGHGGARPDATADSAPAATARSASPASADASAATHANTPTGSGAERGSELAAAPANNFAALHAAALANLRGESTPPAAAPVPLHVATPAGSAGWPEEVGNRVSWMVGHAESHAELTLTPPQLGKVEVSITVSGDQTSAQIVAATPAARDLIEQSLPRLREILEQSGISLGQADVGTSGQPGDGRRGSAWSPSRGSADGGSTNTVSGPWLRRGEGLVDTFA